MTASINILEGYDRDAITACIESKGYSTMQNKGENDKIYVDGLESFEDFTELMRLIYPQETEEFEHKEPLDTIQKTEKLNNVYSVDTKGNGGANHEYIILGIKGNMEVGHVQFQNGGRNTKDSIDGVLDTDLLEIVRDRLIAFQSGDFANKYNEEALYHVEEALVFLNERVMERASRNVLGTHEK